MKDNLAEEFAQVTSLPKCSPLRVCALTFGQAFENVDFTINNAGGKGMSSVYKLAVYYSPITEEALNETIMNLRKWFPNHRPLLTAIGVAKLALPEMHVEIEAWAHVE